MSFKSIIQVSLALLILTGQAFSYDNWGSSVVATGMGGAFVATANDPSGIFYNPAGLARINQYSLYGMYNRQTTFGYFLDEKPYALSGSGAVPFYWGVVGFGISQRGSWSKETQVVTHNTLALSYAKMISSQFSIGTNAKYLFNTNYGDKNGADFDLGLMYFATSQLTFGLAGENLAGTDVEPDMTTTYFLYNRRQVKVGMAYELINGEYRTRFGFDSIFKQKKGLLTESHNLNNFGVQQSIPLSSHTAVSFRAGYSLGKDYNQDFSSFAFGVSYEVGSGNNSYRFDYSYQDYPFEGSESMAGDNRFALTVFFGAPKNGNGYAKHEEKVKLAKVDKATSKAQNENLTPWQPSAERVEDVKPTETSTRTPQPAVDFTQPEIQNNESAFNQSKAKEAVWQAPTESGQEEKPALEIAESVEKPAGEIAQAENTAVQKQEEEQIVMSAAAESHPEEGTPEEAVKAEEKSAPQIAQADEPTGETEIVDENTWQAEAKSSMDDWLTAEISPVPQTEEVKTPVKTDDQKSAFKKLKPEEALWQGPAETGREERLAEELKRPEEKPTIEIAQVISKESMVYEQGKAAKSPAGNFFAGFKISSRVEKVESAARKGKAYMFTFKYNLDEKEREIGEWRILVADQPVNNYTGEGSDAGVMQAVVGKGLPPSIIIWEGKDKNGAKVAPGKHFYSLYLKTWRGEKYLSNWTAFTTE
ncbi:MAG: hypothetical protein A2Z27_01935 [candidate division Zixibacteria bacterium RBG_16_50_21]|nr:MAG: hypothetical protein A2Z27_01935 [candidate division Zixibacteria bacterium RBG_16_50_21]